jgi:hypothetical protein
MSILVLCHGKNKDTFCWTSLLENKNLKKYKEEIYSIDIDKNVKPTKIHNLKLPLQIKDKKFNIITQSCCDCDIYIDKDGNINRNFFDSMYNLLERKGIIIIVIALNCIKKYLKKNHKNNKNKEIKKIIELIKLTDERKNLRENMKNSREYINNNIKKINNYIIKDLKEIYNYKKCNKIPIKQLQKQYPELDLNKVFVKEINKYVDNKIIILQKK